VRSVEILLLLLLLAFSYYAKILDWILILVAFLAASAWAAINHRSDFSISWSSSLILLDESLLVDHKTASGVLGLQGVLAIRGNSDGVTDTSSLCSVRSFGGFKPIMGFPDFSG